MFQHTIDRVLSAAWCTDTRSGPINVLLFFFQCKYKITSKHISKFCSLVSMFILILKLILLKVTIQYYSVNVAALFILVTL